MKRAKQCIKICEDVKKLFDKTIGDIYKKVSITAESPLDEETFPDLRRISIKFKSQKNTLYAANAFTIAMRCNLRDQGILIKKPCLYATKDFRGENGYYWEYLLQTVVRLPDAFPEVPPMMPEERLLPDSVKRVMALKKMKE